MDAQCSSLAHSAQILLSATEGSGEGESEGESRAPGGTDQGELSWAAGQRAPPAAAPAGLPCSSSELIACLQDDGCLFSGNQPSLRPQMAHWPFEGVFSPALTCLVARVAGNDLFSWKEPLNRFLTTDIPSTIFFFLYSLV